VQEALSDHARKQRRDRIRNRQQKRGRMLAVWSRRAERLRKLGRRVYLDRLPPLGEFAREGLGEERARFLQRVIFSTTFWWMEVRGLA
jgi:hypothetical protein